VHEPRKYLLDMMILISSMSHPLTTTLEGIDTIDVMWLCTCHHPLKVHSEDPFPIYPCLIAECLCCQYNPVDNFIMLEEMYNKMERKKSKKVGAG
jgi:hypothetical protein